MRFAYRILQFTIIILTLAGPPIFVGMNNTGIAMDGVLCGNNHAQARSRSGGCLYASMISINASHYWVNTAVEGSSGGAMYFRTNNRGLVIQHC